MGRSYSHNALKKLRGKPIGRRSLGNSSRGWEDNILIVLIEKMAQCKRSSYIKWFNVRSWMYSAQGRDPLDRESKRSSATELSRGLAHFSS